jgi:hypothetical protein
MPAYDSDRFDPPAPLAYVTLRNADNGTALPDVPMLLDSGADVTLVPRSTVGELGAELVSDSRYELVGFDGGVSFANIVWLEMVFCGRTFRGRFLLIDQPWGILGRNILNAVALFFDGPRLVWEEKRSG